MVYRPPADKDPAQDLHPGHNVRPLENFIPDCGRRHAVIDLPSFDLGLKAGAVAYLADREVIRANFFQLAAKVEQMRAALQAMGVPITEKE
jgi:hypothetical protein